MCRFFESIKIKDGVVCRLKLHQDRVNKAFAAGYPDEDILSLFEVINQSVILQSGIYKCRIVYDSDLISLEIAPYVRHEIKSLRMVDTDMESYSYKQEDRTQFNEAFAKRGECDDVLLVRNGLLTDTSYSNIALYDGTNWFTPRIPLLYGVNRAELLESGKLIEKDIAATELKNYKQIALFNAMIEFGELILPVSQIF
ncbi:MAG: aminotransferase class IV [Paludibacter sp.]|nr:aminotransferase class IV [Paludibacter sp.]